MRREGHSEDESSTGESRFLGHNHSWDPARVRERLHEKVCQDLSAALMHLEGDHGPEQRSMIKEILRRSVDDLREIANGLGPEQDFDANMRSELVRLRVLVNLHNVPIHFYLQGEESISDMTLQATAFLRYVMSSVMAKGLTRHLSIRGMLGKMNEVEVIERGDWDTIHPFEMKAPGYDKMTVEYQRLSVDERRLLLKY